MSKIERWKPNTEVDAKYPYWTRLNEAGEIVYSVPLEAPNDIPVDKDADDADKYALYWKEDCIVVTDLISEAPIRESAPHEACLEKMLVDMFCDKLISTTYSKAEFPEALQKAMTNWLIEKPKMLRYARRRGKEAEIRKILEEL